MSPPCPSRALPSLPQLSPVNSPRLPCEDHLSLLVHLPSCPPYLRPPGCSLELVCPESWQEEMKQVYGFQSPLTFFLLGCLWSTTKSQSSA